MWTLEKMVQVILSANQKQRHRRREQTYGHQVEEGGGGMNEEMGIDTYISLLCLM